MKKNLSLAALAASIATPAFSQVMAPDDYVKAAGASDLFERQSAQVVLEMTKDPKVRDFATMMLTAHAKSTAMVKAAAERSKVPVAPPVLMPVQAELISQLQAESGPARDATYISQQKAAHGQALSVQQAYAMGGTAAPLKAAATSIVPVVKMHIAMLETM